MGRFLLGVGLLGAFLGVGIWINAQIGNVCKPLEQTLQAAATKDLEEAAALTQQAKTQWEKRRAFLSVFFDHAPIETIDSGFSQLLLCKEKADFAAKCVLLQHQLAALNSTHRPSLENIL